MKPISIWRDLRERKKRSLKTIDCHVCATTAVFDGNPSNDLLDNGLSAWRGLTKPWRASSEDLPSLFLLAFFDDILCMHVGVAL